jgi:hypothetical protein
MRVQKMTSAAMVGTSAMTLFSYGVSKEKQKQFREPELLGILIRKLFPSLKFGNAVFSGWALHYAVGALFCIGYDRIWRDENKGPSMANGALLGAISGIVGVSGWHLTLKLHPNPPFIDLKKYYGHLLTAHVAFGIFSAVGYRLPKLLNTKTIADRNFLKN